LVDTMLSATRDLAAAKAFFKPAMATVGHKPERVTTDKHAAFSGAIRLYLQSTSVRNRQAVTREEMLRSAHDRYNFHSNGEALLKTGVSS
jgi:transposase-like protein